MRRTERKKKERGGRTISNIVPDVRWRTRPGRASNFTNFVSRDYTDDARPLKGIKKLTGVRDVSIFSCSSTLYFILPSV